MTKEEAVKWLKRIRMNYPSRNVEHVESDVALYMAVKALEQEPKTGYWIIEVWNNKEHHTCSNCQHVTFEPCYHYCSYCGAKMVETGKER